MTADLYTFLAVDAHRTPRTGSLPAGTDVEAWVRGRFRARWRSLVVTRADGIVIARIVPPRQARGRREWFAEVPVPETAPREWLRTAWGWGAA